MSTVEQLRTIALSLPETIERTSYGNVGFRVKDRLFARMRTEDVLVVWCASEFEKAALIASEPDKFFTTPHYDGYPAVLVWLSKVDPVELRELLIEGWLARAPKRVLAAHAADLLPSQE